MKRESYLLGLLFFSVNIFLWVGGFTGADELPDVYKKLPDGLSDLNGGSDFQNELILKDDNNVNINDVNTQFVSTDLTFIESVGALRFIFDIFQFVVDFIVNATFGMTLAALKFNVPIRFVIGLGAINFGIVSIGVFELGKEFFGAKGGTRL